MTKTAKPISLAVLVVVLLPAGALAQGYQPPPPGYVPPAQYAPAPQYKPFRPHVELVGFAGYHLSSDLNYTSGHATIDGSASYGAALRFVVRPGEAGELLWIYVPTNAHFTTLTLGSGSASLAINYFQIGGSKSFRADRVEPYFGATLGAAIFAPGTLRLGTTQLNGSDIWRFAFTVGGGLKIWLIEQLAIQLDARMLVPVWFSSGAFYAGGGGAAFAVSGGIPIVEGNFTGGIVVAL